MLSMHLPRSLSLLGVVFIDIEPTTTIIRQCILKSGVCLLLVLNISQKLFYKHFTDGLLHVDGVVL